jgi:hypothetical protein
VGKIDRIVQLKNYFALPKVNIINKSNIFYCTVICFQINVSTVSSSGLIQNNRMTKYDLYIYDKSTVNYFKNKKSLGRWHARCNRSFT